MVGMGAYSAGSKMPTVLSAPALTVGEPPGGWTIIDDSASSRRQPASLRCSESVAPEAWQ